MARIGNTDLDVFPLCLGGNVFGWNHPALKGLTIPRTDQAGTSGAVSW